MQTCLVGTTSCDLACCPNSLVRQINLDSNWADQACCPDCESHSPPLKSGILSRYSCIILLIVTNQATNCYSALQSTHFCSDDSWAMRWIAGPANSGYFCCLEGQIGLTSKQCVSNEEVIASSLAASFVRNSFYLTFVNRIYHSMDLTYNSL
jgi:hypothetical protein